MVTPLNVVRKGRVVMVITLYTLLQIIQSTVPFWFGISYKYGPVEQNCHWQISEIFRDNATELTAGEEGKAIAIYTWLVVIQFLPPTLVVIVTGCVSCGALRSHDSNALKRDATVTVILLTAACVVINAPVIISISVPFYEILTRSNPPNHPSFTSFRIFAYNHCTALNGIINAIIYVSRLRKLRRFLGDLALVRKPSVVIRRILSKRTGSSRETAL